MFTSDCHCEDRPCCGCGVSSTPESEAEAAYDRMLDTLYEESLGYCDYCEEEGHTFCSCPSRDDESEAV